MTCMFPGCDWPVEAPARLCGEHFAHLSDLFQKRVHEAPEEELDAVARECVKYLIASARRTSFEALPAQFRRMSVQEEKPRSRGDGKFRTYAEHLALGGDK